MKAKDLYTWLLQVGSGTIVTPISMLLPFLVIAKRKVFLSMNTNIKDISLRQLKPKTNKCLDLGMRCLPRFDKAWEEKKKVSLF